MKTRKTIGAEGMWAMGPPSRARGLGHGGRRVACSTCHLWAGKAGAGPGAASLHCVFHVNGVGEVLGGGFGEGFSSLASTQVGVFFFPAVIPNNVCMY